MEKEKIYIEKFYRFTCKDCPTVSAYVNKDDAKNHGWAIDRSGKICYCPACALKHRSTGCKGASGKKSVYEQLTIGGGGQCVN